MGVRDTDGLSVDLELPIVGGCRKRRGSLGFALVARVAEAPGLDLRPAIEVQCLAIAQPQAPLVAAAIC